jgi:hypothetical protein
VQLGGEVSGVFYGFLFGKRDFFWLENCMVLGLGGFRRADCRDFIILLYNRINIGIRAKRQKVEAPNIWCAEMLMPRL